MRNEKVSGSKRTQAEIVDFAAILEKQNEVKRRRRAEIALKEKATDTSVKLSGMPHGGGDGKQMESYLIAAIEAGNLAQEAELELEELRKPLKKAMRKLKIWQHKDIIRKRYLEGKTVEQTALEIGYEKIQTWRYEKQAKLLINKGTDGFENEMV